jgi:hypothetical protein
VGSQEIPDKIEEKNPQVTTLAADAYVTEMYRNLLPYDLAKDFDQKTPDSEVVTTGKTMEKYADFKTKQLEKGHSFEKIVEAIFATSGDFQLAGAILCNAEESDTLPEDIPGIWTEQDDKGLVTVGTGKLDFTNLPAATDPLERLDNKHGYDLTVPVKIDRYQKIKGKRQQDPSSIRMMFLRNWRLYNWMEIDVDNLISVTPGLRHWESINGIATLQS